jgi:hypothetical protein
MGLLKKTKSLWQLKRSSIPGIPPPLPPVSEVHAPSLPAIQQPPQPRVLPKPLKPTHHITAENIRELREMIRYRYGLDIEIWKQRGLKGHMRDNLKENMRRSDAALLAIRKTLQDWDRREFFATEEQYQKFQEIKHRLMTGNKMDWEKNKPWEQSMQQMIPIRPSYEMNDRVYEMNGRASSVAQRHSSIPYSNQQIARKSVGGVSSPGQRQSQSQSQRSMAVPPQSQYDASSAQQSQYTATSAPNSSQQNQYAAYSPQYGRRAVSPPQQRQGGVPHPQQSQRVVSSPQQSQGVVCYPQQGQGGVPHPQQGQRSVSSPVQSNGSKTSLLFR